jgi:hypothetical protein
VLQPAEEESALQQEVQVVLVVLAEPRSAVAEGSVELTHPRLQEQRQLLPLQVEREEPVVQAVLLLLVLKVLKVLPPSEVEEAEERNRL